MAFGMDDSMDMGLETNVSDQASVQSGLDPSGETSSIPSIEYNIKPGFVTPYIKSLLKSNLIREIQRNKQGQITGVRAADNPFSPQSIFGNLARGNTQTGIMGLVGSVIGPPGFGALPGLIGGLTGQEVTTYTGYNPEDEQETSGGNVTQGTYNEEGSRNDNMKVEGIPDTINKQTTSDILRAYLENMDNYFELTPGNYLRRVG